MLTGFPHQTTKAQECNQGVGVWGGDNIGVRGTSNGPELPYI